ncbi:MAG: zinc ribbon domain-containing protein [Alkalispirochaeta sp.]
MRRFFCENCGEEVDESADLCPYCGAIFQAIKCPRCGYRGKLHEFRKGCPSCGFLGEEHVRETAPSAIDTVSPSIPHRERRFAIRRETPWWLFWLVLLFMVVAFAGTAILYMAL